MLILCEEHIGIGLLSIGTISMSAFTSIKGCLSLGGFRSADVADLRNKVGQGLLCVGSPSTKWFEQTKVSSLGLKFFFPFLIRSTHCFRFLDVLALFPFGKRCHLSSLMCDLAWSKCGFLWLFLQPSAQQTLAMIWSDVKVNDEYIHWQFAEAVIALCYIAL